MEFKPLPREFYLRDAVQVARELIRQRIGSQPAAGITSGVIVETEAYMGVTDPALTPLAAYATSVRRSCICREDGHTSI